MDKVINNGTILVYNGCGANEFCVQKTVDSLRSYLGNRAVKLVSVDSSYFIPKNLKNTQAVVITGGNASIMRNSFKEEGIKHIRDFVVSGGSYIGFCAGGYLAGPFSFLSQDNDYGAKLISSKLDGPAINLKEDAKELNATTAKAVLIKDEINKENNYYAFWNGGGYYSWYNPGNQRSIAWYQEKPYEQVAVLYSCENKGHVVISNIHPEIQLTPSEIEAIFPAMNNKSQMLSSVPNQKALFGRICDYAGLSEKKFYFL